MKSALLRKNALDALNVEINRPSAAEDPRADTEWVNPWAQKGTEVRASNKFAAIQELTHTSLRYFKQMASRHPGLRPRIEAHCQRLTAALKQAEVEMHRSPKVLPPRDDMRRHLDEDLQKELDADLNGNSK